MSFGGFPDVAREQSYATPVQNSTWLPLLLLSLATQKHTPDTQDHFESEYDYIVVGAGSAGSVVAARLSEDGLKTVLLLEAGKSPPILTEVPAFAPFFVRGSDLHWDYSTEPQKYAAWGYKNRSVIYPIGKTVGGTSAINGMVYQRGNHRDYDTWAAQGSTGWNWKGVFPYFLKAEDNADPDIANNGFHAVGGPMSIVRIQSEYKQSFIDAAVNLGYPYVDSNGARQSGFNDVQANIRRGQRCSTAKAYLVPNENRPNLHIVAEAFVTKVLITDKRAVGVQLDYKGYRYEVRARGEVILSAGALSTPKLLMLSGIGPRKILENFGIPVIADLPVGETFYTRAATTVNFVSSEDHGTFAEKLQDPKNVLEYINDRTGPLVAVSGTFGTAFLANNLQAQKRDLPEYQLHFAEGSRIPDSNIRPEVYDRVYGPYRQNQTFSCGCQCLSPRSRGYVSIRSADPYDAPLIDPKYLEDPQDLQAIVSGLKECYRIMQSPVFQKLGIRPFATLMPGCEELVSDVDKYLECYTRTMLMPISHHVGTAKMGDVRDPTTVVDPQLRVKGIEKLRVVDASVMPMVPRGNINNPVIMIAEKGSDIIKGCYEIPFSDNDIFY